MNCSLATDGEGNFEAIIGKSETVVTVQLLLFSKF